MKTALTHRPLRHLVIPALYELLEDRRLLATYYVGTVNAANTTSNGTSASSPFATIVYAASRATASGDEIVLLDGTYTETASINLALGVSVRGNTTDATRAVVKGTFGGSLFRLAQDSGVVNGNHTIKDLTIDGNTRQVTVGVANRGRNNVTLSNLIIKNCQIGITSRAQDANPGLNGARLTGCSITNVRITGTGTDGGGNIEVGQWHGGSISRCSITSTANKSIGIKSGWGGYNQGLKIYDNVIETSYQAGVGSAICFSIEQDNPVASATYGATEIYDNQLNNGVSFTANDNHQEVVSGVRNLRFHHNRIVATTDTDAEAVEQYVSYAEISHNYVERINAGIGTHAGTDYTGSNDIRDVLIHHNVFRGKLGGTSAAGQGILMAGGEASFTNWKVYNNTFDYYNVGLQVNGGTGIKNGIDLKNNLFYNVTTILYSYSSQANTTNVSFNYNAYHGHTNFQANSGTGNMAVTVGANNVSASPQIVGQTNTSANRPSPFYYPASTSSPLYNGGVSIAGVTDGHFGTAPDIGAFEMQYTTAFTSTFESGSTSGWTPNDGTKWSTVTDGTGRYQGSSTSTTWTTAGSTSWSDYSVEAKVKATTLNADSNFSIIGRFQSNNAYYYAHYSNTSKTFQFYKMANGVKTAIGTAFAFTAAANTDYHLRATFKGSTMTLYLNNAKICTATDTSYATGKVGLRLFNSTVRYDDVYVTAT